MGFGTDLAFDGSGHRRNEKVKRDVHYHRQIRQSHRVAARKNDQDVLVFLAFCILTCPHNLDLSGSQSDWALIFVRLTATSSDLPWIFCC